MKDLFFDQSYGRLYETVEAGKCEVFEFQHKSGTIKHTYIKREIAVKIDGETYYDLVTPFMYGGPVISNCSEDDKWELVDEFQRTFEAYCEENNIICEFVRFHPVHSNVLDFVSYYEVDYVGDTVATNLASYRSPAQVEFSASIKSAIRDSLCAGVEYSVSTKPQQLQKFQDFYLNLSNHVNCNGPAYFDEQYFNQCMESFSEYVVIVEVTYKGITIGMSLNFLNDKAIYCHLALTLPEFETLSPGSVLQYGLTLWGKANGYELVHLGGGEPNKEDDELYLYKKQFGRNTSFQQCVGKKVWNPEVYRKVCAAFEVGVDGDFFPAYRVKVSENLEATKTVI